MTFLQILRVYSYPCVTWSLLKVLESYVNTGLCFEISMFNRLFIANWAMWCSLLKSIYLVWHNILLLRVSIFEIVEAELEVDVMVEAIGHQWYWTYEQHTDFNGDAKEVESYMVSTGDLVPGGCRLLEVDNKLIVPMGTYLRVLVTGADVIHSFAVPAHTR